MTHFFGLDFAFANNGLVILDESARIIKQEVVVTTKRDSDENRLIKLRNYVNSLVKSDDIVYIEGLSYGSISTAKAQMGAVQYIIRILLKERNIKYKVIEPTTLKKFITGKGQCKKDLILLKVFKKWNVEFDNSDLADAYGLARLAFEDYKND